MRKLITDVLCNEIRVLTLVYTARGRHKQTYETENVYFCLLTPTNCPHSLSSGLRCQHNRFGPIRTNTCCSLRYLNDPAPQFEAREHSPYITPQYSAEFCSATGDAFTTSPPEPSSCTSARASHPFHCCTPAAHFDCPHQRTKGFPRQRPWPTIHTSVHHAVKCLRA